MEYQTSRLIRSLMEWVRGFAELTAKRTGMGLWTRRLNRVRTRTMVVWQGSAGNRRLNADQITMSPTTKSGRHDQENLPRPVPFPCR